MNIKLTVSKLGEPDNRLLENFPAPYSNKRFIGEQRETEIVIIAFSDWTFFYLYKVSFFETFRDVSWIRKTLLTVFRSFYSIFTLHLILNSM